MDKFELTCKQCGTRYRLLRRPAKNELECKKCKAMIAVDLPPAERVDRAGQSLGGYTILKLLSKGPRCNLYRAEQVAMRRTVALKMLGDEFLADTAAVDAFVGHAKLVAGVQHHCIVSIYDINAVDVPYYSMEFVDGATAGVMIETAGSPPVEDALRIGQDIGSALAAAVRGGIANFRVAADTLMLTDRGEVKILPSAFSADECGKAPDESANAALGSFLYLLLTGRELDASARSVTPPSKLNPAVPNELDAVVLQMLKPKKGYSSIVTATQALKHLADKASGNQPHRETHRYGAAAMRPRAKRSKATLVVAGALIAACIAIMILVVLFISNRRHVTAQLDEIQYLYVQKQYEKVIAAGEEFISSHPRNQNVAGIQQMVADSLQQSQARKRQADLEDAFRKICDEAKKQPGLLLTYETQITELGEAFKDMSGIGWRISGYTATVRDIWNKEAARFESAIRKAANQEDFIEVFKVVDELDAVLKTSGMPPLKSGINIETVRKDNLDKVNSWYYTIRNKALELEWQKKPDEAIKLYQKVVDKSGMPDLVKRAQDNIDRIQGKTPAAPEQPKDPAPVQPDQPAAPKDNQPAPAKDNPPAPAPEKKEQK